MKLRNILPLVGAALLLAPTLRAADAQAATSRDGASGKATSGALHVAVIVHSKNPISEISLAELRQYFALEKRFWPNRSRVALYMRPSKTKEQKVLLETIYEKSSRHLKKYWKRMVFMGDIPGEPSYAGTTKAAVDRVRRKKGGMSVIMGTKAPKGVKVLAIRLKKSGKALRPGDAGYPLVYKPKPAKK
ncbi:MAG: hypothetical protein V3T86_05455 [Planctomycetota bacterium]